MTTIRTTTTGTRPTGISPDQANIPQLSPRGIAAVWAAAALPMGVLAWVFAPWLADQLSGPSAFTRSMITALTIGLAWQFVLVMLLVRREQGTLRWSVLREVCRPSPLSAGPSALSVHSCCGSPSRDG